MTKLPHITLERNNAGALFVGLTEFDGRGIATRSCVLTMSSHYVAEKVIGRRFDDIVRLAGDHATSENLL